MVPSSNRLLMALPKHDRQRLEPHLKLVSLSLGEALYESGGSLRHVYFPINSIVSLLSVMADGASAEIAVVGNDGVVGVSIHGWRDDSKPCGRTERGRHLTAQGRCIESRIHARGRAA